MDPTHEVTCPYCGETVTILVDLGGGRRQSYVEDCQVCCRPWEVIVTLLDNEVTVDVRTSD